MGREGAEPGRAGLLTAGAPAAWAPAGGAGRPGSRSRQPGDAPLGLGRAGSERLRTAPPRPPAGLCRLSAGPRRSAYSLPPQPAACLAPPLPSAALLRARHTGSRRRTCCSQHGRHHRRLSALSAGSSRKHPKRRGTGAGRASSSQPGTTGEFRKHPKKVTPGDARASSIPKAKSRLCLRKPTKPLLVLRPRPQTFPRPLTVGSRQFPETPEVAPRAQSRPRPCPAPQTTAPVDHFRQHPRPGESGVVPAGGSQSLTLRFFPSVSGCFQTLNRERGSPVSVVT